MRTGGGNVDRETQACKGGKEGRAREGRGRTVWSTELYVSVSTVSEEASWTKQLGSRLPAALRPCLSRAP